MNRLTRTEKAFLAAYVECALWTSTDESDERGGEPMDRNYGAHDIAGETVEAMTEDCLSFLAKADHLIGTNYAGAGHDFWLTRNGHGAGFWDGDWTEHGDELTAIAKSFGETHLYVADNGKVYSD